LTPGRAEVGVWLIRMAVGAASGNNHRATDIARAVLAANNVTDADSKGVQTLARPYRWACGITLAGVCSRLARGCRRGGGWPPTKIEFSGIGELRTHIGNCAGESPSRHFLLRPQLPPELGPFFRLVAGHLENAN
jgi:hypothetical protein